MGQHLLASVGTVQLFDDNNALICTSKTLTDSGINMAVSAEEARGGQGNALLGKYFHDTSFSLTLTDQLFSLQYLALNCGGAITAGADVMKQEQISVTVANQITVTGTPVKFGDEYCGWYRKASEADDAYKKITFSGSVASVADLAVGDVVCVKYFIHSDTARKFTVSSAYIPSTVHAVMTVPLFKAGTSSESVSSSSQIGELVVEIPKFQLEGANELSLSASGIATSSLSGSALAVFDGSEGCSGNGYYAIITENIFNKDAFSDAIAIVVEDSDVDLEVSETQTLKVLVLYSDGTQPSRIDPSLLTFTSATTTVATVGSHTGVVTAVAQGESVIDVTVTSKPTLVAKAVVTVTE